MRDDNEGGAGAGWSRWELPIGLSGVDEARAWSESARKAVEEATLVLRQAQLHEWFEWLRNHPVLSTVSNASGVVTRGEYEEDYVNLQLDFADGSSLRHVNEGFGIKVVHSPATSAQEAWSKSASNLTMIEAVVKLGACVPEWNELLADTSLPMEWAVWRAHLFTPEEIARQEQSVMERSASAARAGAKSARL